MDADRVDAEEGDAAARHAHVAADAEDLVELSAPLAEKVEARVPPRRLELLADGRRFDIRASWRVGDGDGLFVVVDLEFVANPRHFGHDGRKNVADRDESGTFFVP